MTKQICCDLCNKILTEEEGIRFIGMSFVEGVDFINYPETFSSKNFLSKDLCSSCSEKIIQEINRIEKINQVKKEK